MKWKQNSTFISPLPPENLESRKIYEEVQKASKTPFKGTTKFQDPAVETKPQSINFILKIFKKLSK